MFEHDVVELEMRVAKLERMVAFLEHHLGIRFHDIPIPGVPPEVVALARSGDKLGAIKLHCKLTGADLVTAKALVESIP
jgi:ribosomal protein L7/L12